ncbi:MAG: tRNA uridine-5-carboxymethylaminomethyl(34) synthesis GTPase MnmE [Clostridia bacterium]|nr:tRNA uridine-5-carboxymethylaminomethyl(34) synthesis GTPase MnmE [Clostridia bacterium]
MLNDTIAAVSTPRGKGGVAMIRVSGADAVEICERVFVPHNGKTLSACAPRYAVYGHIFVTDADGSRSEIDDGVATVFRAPSSFTGEDTVEICCHGGILLTETVLTAVLAAGARPAEAGEFTKRAFLNGKMGLSSAEALGNLLEAQSREQILLAHTGMNGRTEARCAELYAKLRHLLASVYVCIDYPDEDLAELSREEILEGLSACAEDVRRLADTYRTGHAVAEGIQTVICGRPNVGKSSLYNRIVGRDAAIVTDVEGTTRDVLTETAHLGRVTLRLSDTAGLHETSDRVERIGIDRAREELERAELILAVFDASCEPNEADLALCGELTELGVAAVAVLNKSDLSGEDCSELYGRYFKHTVSISAQTGAGMDKLAALIEELFVDGALDLRADAVLANARQHAAALKASRALDVAAEALRMGYPVDVCCSDVEAAMEALSELDGRAVSEDLVSEIFSHFCVGK